MLSICLISRSENWANLRVSFRTPIDVIRVETCLLSLPRAFAAAGLMPRIAARLSANQAAPAAASPANAIAPVRVAAAAPAKQPVAATAPEPKPVATAVASRDADGFGFRRVDLPVGPGGHFRANVEIEGRTVPMLVDTGASYVALSAEDADRLGVITRPHFAMTTSRNPAR
jgi:predicted aspartyl protease